MFGVTRELNRDFFVQHGTCRSTSTAAASGDKQPWGASEAMPASRGPAWAQHNKQLGLLFYRPAALNLQQGAVFHSTAPHAQPRRPHKSGDFKMKGHHL